MRAQCNAMIVFSSSFIKVVVFKQQRVQGFTFSGHCVFCSACFHLPERYAM